MSQLYALYTETCLKEGKSQLSRHSFDKIFEEMNLSLFTPKKDKCDVCTAYEYKSGNVTEEEYIEHRKCKDEARSEKEADKLKGIDGKFHVFTQDVQAVKLVPCVNASATYYKTKLQVHNFTMYNIGTHDVVCYWFDETTSNLDASSFASCIVDNLKTALEKDVKPVILWSDGACYQNRNSVLSNALLHLAKEKSVCIEQKYLTKGHTQMECDSVHSSIETKLKNRDIFLPSQYSTITKEARKRPFLYRSKFLTYEFFKDFSQKETLAYDSIRPGVVKSDPKVNDIKSLCYNPNRTIDYKLDFKSEYQPLPRRPNQKIQFISTSDFPQLHTSINKIKLSKWDHLQQLKSVIPTDCHPFYDTLPHRTKDDMNQTKENEKNECRKTMQKTATK